MAPLFAVVLFISSSLMFVSEPMIARMLLPLLGGTPAVWNTCMVFFQGMLFIGYLYAYATTKWLRPGAQALLHAGLWVVSIAALPVAIPADANPNVGSPISWLLTTLVRTIGLPFFLLATSSPLFQQWFASWNRHRATDPYVLYAAGNAGSLIALLSYPVILEPQLRLGQQSRAWGIGYGALALLIVVCAAAMMRASRGSATRAHDESVGSATRAHDESVGSATRAQDQLLAVGSCSDRAITLANRARWVALAAIPSSLVLAVTTYLTTDIAAVPMLWVLPLALYLLTFVVAFGVRSVAWHPKVIRLFTVVCLPMTVLVGLKTQLPAAVLVPAHLLTFFLAALVCHGELWHRRPDASQLTEFYVWLAFGGLAGGLFTALVAPVVFTSIVEYPLALVLACAVRPAVLRSRDHACDPTRDSEPIPGIAKTTRARRVVMDVGLPCALGAATFAACELLTHRRTSLVTLIALSATLVLYRWSNRPWRFALGVAALLVSLAFTVNGPEHVVYRGRSFFGAHRVVIDDANSVQRFVHGSTLHGAQSLDPIRRQEPLTYYSRTGPIGQLFEAFSGERAKPRVGVIGLGVGTMAAYGERGQQWTFFEIDPAVTRLARDPNHFTYLTGTPAHVDIVLGDARISLERWPARSFDLLVLDAFSADAIPVHLVTREALQLYVKTLDERGILAFHISNRYFDMRPELAALARDTGLTCLTEDDLRISAADQLRGKSPSRWLLMARTATDFGPLVHDERWQPLTSALLAKVWTDDFSNLLSLMTWRSF